MNKNYIGTYGVIKKKWRNRSYLFSKLWRRRFICLNIKMHRWKWWIFKSYYIWKL